MHRFHLVLLIAAGTVIGNTALADAQGRGRGGQRQPPTAAGPTNWVSAAADVALADLIHTETAQKGGEERYVCRVVQGRQSLPGWSNKGGSCSAIAPDGTPLVADATKSELLTGRRNVQWQQADVRTRQAPTTALAAGQTGVTMHYVCRARPERTSGGAAILIGRVDDNGRRCAYLDENGGVQRATDFDYLVVGEARSRQGEGRVFEDRGRKSVDCEPERLTLPCDAAGRWSSNLTVRGVTGATITGIEQEECQNALCPGADTGPDGRVARGGRTLQVKQECCAGTGRLYYVTWESPSCPEPSPMIVEIRKAPRVACTDEAPAGGRFDSLSASDERCNRPDCNPELELVENGVDASGDSWYTFVIKGVPDNKYKFTTVAQDECRDGEPAVQFVSDKKIKVRVGQYTSRGRLYQFGFRATETGVCPALDDGKDHTVDWGFKDNGAGTVTWSREWFDLTKEVLDEKCCESDLAGSTTYRADSWQTLDLSTIPLFDRVVSVEQSECVGEVSSRDTEGAVQVVRETNTTATTRLYRVTYTCGPDRTEKQLFFEITRSGARSIDPPDVGTWYDTTKVGNCCEPDLASSTTYQDNSWFALDLTTAPLFDKIVSVEQSECAFEVSSRQTGGTVDVLRETNTTAKTRLYRVTYTCDPDQTEKQVYFEVTRSGARSITPPEVSKWHDTTKVATGPECDNTPPANVLCRLKRPDGMQAPAAEYCLTLNDGRQETLGLIYSATDDVTAADKITFQVVGITSDERTNRDTSDPYPDAAMTSAAGGWFRAERSPTGNGRVYQIQLRATDAAGNSGDGGCSVMVPAGSAMDCTTVIDSRGPEYDATARN